MKSYLQFLDMQLNRIQQQVSENVTMAADALAWATRIAHAVRDMKGDALAEMLGLLNPSVGSWRTFPSFAISGRTDQLGNFRALDKLEGVG